jgi:hypothetical protein
MSISARATAKIQPLPESERPLSEQYRLIARKFVDADAAANLLEETKSAVLAQMMVAKGDMPVSRAEMLVKASEDWDKHIKKMVEARKEANLLKLQLEYIRLRHSEWMSENANQRAERRMT